MRSSTTWTGAWSSRTSSGPWPCRRFTSRSSSADGTDVPPGSRGSPVALRGGSMATSLLPVIGKPAPDFTLPSTTGENISLRQFKGKKTVILYFYPKDETPGCTREACDFRDHAADLETAGTVILGVSTDSLESHHHFKDK